MRRLFAASAAILLSLGMATTALAAAPLGHTGRVVISTEGDVTIPAGEHADVVVVVKGAAHIQGEVMVGDWVENARRSGVTSVRPTESPLSSAMRV